MTTGLLFPDLELPRPAARPKPIAPTVVRILQDAIQENGRRIRARERLRMRGWKIIHDVEPIPYDSEFYGDPDAADVCDDDGCCNETLELESGFPECPVCCAHWCDQCWRDNGGRCLNGCE